MTEEPAKSETRKIDLIPPPIPQKVCLTPMALDKLLFPECEATHPECFIEFFHGDEGKSIRKSVFSSSFFRTVGLKGSGKSSSMRGRSLTAGATSSTPSATAMDGNDIAEMFGFVEAPVTPSSSSSTSSSSSSSSSSNYSNLKLPLPPQEDMIARALGAASGYGEDLLLRQQENFAKKVQNRSRSLAQNDFGNSWTRRIPVHPHAHPQTKNSPRNGSARPMTVPRQTGATKQKMKEIKLRKTESHKETPVEASTSTRASTSPPPVPEASLDNEDVQSDDDESPLRQNLPTNNSLASMETRARSPTAPAEMEKQGPSEEAIRVVAASTSTSSSISLTSNPTPTSSSSSSSSSSAFHHEKTASVNAEIVVHNLAPEAFRAVRKVFGFSFKRFASSLGAAPLLPKGNGGGRSGARFFLSHDERYVVKSIVTEEVNVLLGLMPDYLEHVISNATHTLLPRFLGLFRVELPGVKNSIDLIVMPNLFRLRKGSDIKISNCYDLKGCFYKGRYEKPHEKDPMKVLKDRNFCPHHVRKKDPFRFTNSSISSSSSLSSLTLSSSSHSTNSSERRHALVDKHGTAASTTATPLAANTPTSSSTDVIPQSENELDADTQDSDNNTVGIDGIGPSSGFVDLCEMDDDEDDLGGVCEKLRLGYDRKAVFVSNLRNDTHWLQEHGLMDYSILLAVGTCSINKVMAEKRARKWKLDQASELYNKGISKSTSPEAVFRYGTPSAKEQTEEELKYLLSSRKPLDGREIERVQELIRATKDVDLEKAKDDIISDEYDKNDDDDKKVDSGDKEKEDENGLNTQLSESGNNDDDGGGGGGGLSSVFSGTSRKGMDLGSFKPPVSLQSVMGDDDDVSSDEEGGTIRPKRIVSYWESELGGVSAAERNTGIRITMSKNADRFDLGFNSSKRSNSNKEKDKVPQQRVARSLTTEELEKAPSFEDEKDNDDDNEGDDDDDDDFDVSDEREWYRFGLIDILQTWNMRKRAENIAKVTMMGVDPNAVSSINPKKYADRMTAFFEKHTS